MNLSHLAILCGFLGSHAKIIGTLTIGFMLKTFPNFLARPIPRKQQTVSRIRESYLKIKV